MIYSTEASEWRSIRRFIDQSEFRLFNSLLEIGIRLGDKALAFFHFECQCT